MNTYNTKKYIIDYSDINKLSILSILVISIISIYILILLITFVIYLRSNASDSYFDSDDILPILIKTLYPIFILFFPITLTYFISQKIKKYIELKLEEKEINNERKKRENKIYLEQLEKEMKKYD